MKPITKAQAKVLKLYINHIEQHGFAPTYKEAGKLLGKSVSVIHGHILNLCKKGFTEKLGRGYVKIIKKENYTLADLQKENKELKEENERLKKTIDKLIN